MSAHELLERLRQMGDAERARHAQRYFKTGPGEYGEGDVFLGIRMPQIRQLAREHRDESLVTCRELLESELHEARMLGVLILVQRFERGAPGEQRAVYEIYLAHTHRINNWDLVDSSAPRIVGGWLRARSRRPLWRLARSPMLWERRIAVLATFAFLDDGESSDLLELATLLLDDPEDLIHKAVGWGLRELAKRDLAAAEAFLVTHQRRMPRTMLRYAIERFDPERRALYLAGTAG